MIIISTVYYKIGEFYYAAKAFDVLERLDPNLEYWEGNRGAGVGLFQLIVSNKESKDKLREIVLLLRNSNNPQIEYIIKKLKRNVNKKNYQNPYILLKKIKKNT